MQGRIVTKRQGKLILGHDPEEFPPHARDFSAVFRQCGCHKFHESSEWKSSFVVIRYGGVWKELGATHTGF